MPQRCELEFTWFSAGRCVVAFNVGCVAFVDRRKFNDNLDLFTRRQLLLDTLSPWLRLARDEICSCEEVVCELQ